MEKWPPVGVWDVFEVCFSVVCVVYWSVVVVAGCKMVNEADHLPTNDEFVQNELVPSLWKSIFIELVVEIVGGGAKIPDK